MTGITINVKATDVLRGQLAEVKVSPAIQQATGEAVRQSVGIMAIMQGVALDYLRQAHKHRIVTEADLAKLGVKRLPAHCHD